MANKLFTYKTYWVADDGQEFETEKKCLEYEKNEKETKRFLSLKTFSLDSNDGVFGNYDVIYIPMIFFTPKTEEDLKLVKDRMDYSSKNNYLEVNDILRGSKGFTDIKLGDTIGWYYEDAGDHMGTNHFYTLEYIKKQLLKYLDQLK